MCQKAAETVGTVMKAIEPTLIQLLTLEGVASTEQGQTAITAFDAALVAVENWQSGTKSTEVVQLIDAFVSVFNTLPLPTSDKALVDIITAGVTTVIGILTANSPAPAAPAGQTVTATDEELQQAHASDVEAETTAKVAALVPGFKRSRFHSPEWQYKKAWNTAVKNMPEKYQALEQ